MATLKLPHIKALSTPKDIAMLDHSLQLLAAAANFSSGAVTIDVWTTTTRPAAPQLGTFGFNLTLNSIEIYGTSGWYVFGGSNATATIWTVATRPSPGAIGQMGFNTDFGGQEVYTAAGWKVLNGMWAHSARPTGVAVGSKGFNTTDVTEEFYDGVSPNGGWNQL
jgi:hypothetical protein